jgi:hypothetical protein
MFGSSPPFRFGKDPVRVDFAFEAVEERRAAGRCTRRRVRRVLPGPVGRYAGTQGSFRRVEG